jgi:hypothetical protein
METKNDNKEVTVSRSVSSEMLCAVQKIEAQWQSIKVKMKNGTTLTITAQPPFYLEGNPENVESVLFLNEPTILPESA